MDQALITIAQARAAVLDATPAPLQEVVEIDAALDRVLCREVASAGPVPPFDCSAMDGYAVQAGGQARTLTVSTEARAGRISTATVASGEAARISTGAMVPAGADAVIRQEDTRPLDGGRVELLRAVQPGANIRRAGEDMRPGAVLLRAGTRLGPTELGVAVAAGAARVPVSRRPVVAVLCTGDELRAPGAPLGPGEIHNSLGPMLTALCRRCGALAEPVQRLADDLGVTIAALRSALGRADVVVVSGGVSVGPHDHVRPALRELGAQQRFWGVALQPGKPTWFGSAGPKLVFGLPGNPVSSVVTFTLFVAPALRRLLGVADPPGPRRARLAVPVARNSRREQALRVRLSAADAGSVATPNGPQGSHIVTSLLGAQALALIPAGDGSCPAGSEVQLEPVLA